MVKPDETLELNERERLVLQAIVDEHVRSGEPVASKALTEMGVSSATIRAVMQALSERGFLAQPHTSAGRVPTDRGFRYYVDEIMRLKAPSPEEQVEIGERIEHAGAVDRAMAEASRALSKLARQASIVTAPRSNAVRLRQIELVRLRDDAVLVILVTVEGIVQNRLVELGGVAVAPTAPELERMSNELTALLVNRTLDEGRVLLAAEITTLDARAAHLGREGLRDEDEAAVHVDGTSHLLGASELPRVKDVLALLDEKRRVSQILDAALAAPGIRVFIGEENRTKELADLTLITATYGTPGEVLGTLGVIGPMRLDYARVVPLVEYTAASIGRLMQTRKRS